MDSFPIDVFRTILEFCDINVLKSCMLVNKSHYNKIKGMSSENSLNGIRYCFCGNVMILRGYKRRSMMLHRYKGHSVIIYKSYLMFINGVKHGLSCDISGYRRDVYYNGIKYGLLKNRMPPHVTTDVQYNEIIYHLQDLCGTMLFAKTTYMSGLSSHYTLSLIHI